MRISNREIAVPINVAGAKATLAVASNIPWSTADTIHDNLARPAADSSRDVLSLLAAYVVDGIDASKWRS